MSLENNIALYTKLLLKWQQKINLISPNTISEVHARHINDSLQLTNYIDGDAIIDLGSGAGLPGLILAIETGKKTCLIESDRKKCLFLEEVARQLKLEHVIVINKRIESAALPVDLKHAVITARALASLEKLFELIKSFLEKNKISSYKLILPKGKNADAEIEEARKNWSFSFQKHPSITDPAASVLIIDKFEKL